MRALLILALSLVLVACGGGGGASGSSSTPPPIPFGSVSGSTFDALIVGGTVSVYDFSTGAKGALLGKATSDASGKYSVAVQVETQPLLIEVIGGTYVEEAGAKAQVALEPNHKLRALINYSTGSATHAALTTYTHLAAGLAEYEISRGTAVAAAIDDANQRISTLAGINIQTISPLLIADAGNSSTTLSPELKYGMLAGAISMWTYNHAPSSVASPHLLPYTSIDFAQLLYQDVSADGLLDGVGRDSTGAVAQLSFGTTTLGVDVYRLGLGASMLQMASDRNNLTGLGGASVLSFAQKYVGNTDGMFNNVAPIALTAPVASIGSPAANARVSGTMNVAAAIQSIVGLSKVELLVDGTVAVTASTNLTAPSLQLGTTAYADGVHSIEVRATDWGGQVTNSTVQVLIDNVAPVVAISSPAANSKLNGTVIVAATTQSVAGLSQVELQIDGATVATATNLTAPTFQLVTTAYLDGLHVVGIKATDIGGLVSVSTVQATFANFAPVVIVSTPTANTWVKGSISVAATAQSTIGLSAVELIVDGVSAATATNLTTPAFTINTANYADGAHTVAVRATDVNALVTTNSVPINIDNTPPTSTFVFGGSMCTAFLSGCASDSASGILSVTDVNTGTVLTLDANKCWAVTKTCPWSVGLLYPFVIKDKAGNCGNYQMNLNFGTTSLTSTGPC